jgi:hypothetical protein
MNVWYDAAGIHETTGKRLLTTRVRLLTLSALRAELGETGCTADVGKEADGAYSKECSVLTD